MLSQKALPLRIDSGHCRAICDEIGDRLRILLEKEAGEIPQRLRLLIHRLAELDGVPAPSIVPAMDDMIEWTDAA
jgi:acetoacetate decarboxylase